MKLNHLILVICTGILVGFSACKKDPFTEADAIAAQKELITMKYGYELQLKNIEAAIQKAHDDAAIAITNLNIKGASDLEKQKAQQELASYIARLEADRQDWLKWQAMYDSIDKAEAAQAAANALYDMAEDINGIFYTVDERTGKAVANATVKILKWDGSGYYTGTSNSEGVLVIKQWHIQYNALLRVEGPTNDPKATYINYSIAAYYAFEMYEWLDNPWPFGQILLFSYDPTNTSTIKGTIYAAKDLTNDAADKAGSGIFVKASNVLDILETPSKNDTAIVFSFSTVTNNGAYSLKVPKDVSKYYDADWTLNVASDNGGVIDVYQRAYTLGEGENPYQVLPTIEDSGLVTLSAGSQEWTAGSGYFLSLPNEDSEKGYSMTLTDPLYILPYAMSSLLDQDGVRSPDGPVTYDSSFTQFGFDVDGFVLNNGWMQSAPSEDDSYYYDLPESITPDSTLYNAFMALTQPEKDAIALNQVTQFLLGNVPTADWTPTIALDTTYTNDTLAVELVDLTGFMEEAPELVAIVAGDDEDDATGSLHSIQLLEDANGGLFNIDAVLDGDGDFNTNLFTNHEENYKGANTSDEIDVTASGSSHTKNFYFGVYEDGWEIRGEEEDPYDPSVNGTKDAEDYELIED